MAQPKLTIAIGAALKSSFKQAMSGSRAQLGQLGASIEKLSSKSQSIQSFNQLKRETVSLKTSWRNASVEVKRLAEKIKKTDKPSKDLIKSFNQSKKAALNAKKAYLKKEDALNKLKRNMQQSGIAMSRFSQQQARLGRSVETLKSQYISLDRVLKQRDGVMARRAALRGQLFDTMALGAALGLPLKAAIDFESAMADVKKVVEFKTPEGFKILGRELKNLSRTIPISAAGLAQIAASGGQLGIEAEQLKDFTETVSKMAIAYDMSAEEAGSAMAKLANVYQIPINKMSELGDAINHLSDNTAARARDMVPALNMIGGTARQFGLTAVQSSALVSSFIALGKAPTKAGTAINAMLSKLQTAGKQGAKFQAAFRELGLDIAAFEAQLKTDAQGALISFLKTVEKLNKQERSGVLFDLFGMEYQDDLALLVGSLKEYEKAIAAVGSQDRYMDSMQREFNNRAATTANNLQLLKNSLAEVGINLGTLVLPALNSIVGAVRGVTTALANFAEHYPLISKVIAGITFGLIGLKVATIALGFAWTFVQGGALTLMLAGQRLLPVLLNVKTALMGLNTTILISVARVKMLAVGGALQSLSKVFMRFGATTLPLVMSGFKTFFNLFKKNPFGLFLTAVGLSLELLAHRFNTIQEIFMAFWEPIKSAWGSFVDFVSGFWEAIQKPFVLIGQLWDKIWGDEKKADIKLESDKQIKTMVPLRAASHHHTQHVNIKIETQAHQDSREIADVVVQRLREQSQSALYDPIGTIP